MGAAVSAVLVVYVLRDGAAVLQLCRDAVHDGCVGVLAVEVPGMDEVSWCCWDTLLTFAWWMTW